MTILFGLSCAGVREDDAPVRNRQSKTKKQDSTTLKLTARNLDHPVAGVDGIYAQCDGYNPARERPAN